MPKNKDANDAWVKGAQFIDLVNLGTKQDSAPAKAETQGVYINPTASTGGAAAGGFQPSMGVSAAATGPGGFQPMAHLTEQ